MRSKKLIVVFFILCVFFLFLNQSYAGDDTLGIGGFGYINFPNGLKCDSVKIETLSQTILNTRLTKEEIAQFPCKSKHYAAYINGTSAPYGVYLTVTGFAAENVDESVYAYHRYARNLKFGDAIYNFDNYEFSQTFYPKKSKITEGDKNITTLPYGNSYVKISVFEFSAADKGSREFLNKHLKDAAKIFKKSQKASAKDLVFVISAEGDKIEYHLYPGIGDICVADTYTPADVNKSRGYYVNFYIGNYFVNISSDNLFDENVLVSIAKIVADKLKGVPRVKIEEEPPLETFLDLKLSKNSVPADGKSAIKLSGKLRTKEGKGVPGYPVSVKIDPEYGKISPDSVETDANGNFQFIYTAPQTPEVKEFPGTDKLSARMKVTAENPKTGKTADINDISFVVLSAENPGIDIFMHDEQNNPVYDKVNLAYNLKGKQELKTVFVNNEGKLFYPLPQGAKVNIIYKDDTYLTFTQSVTVPAKVDILRTTLKDYAKNLQKKMNSFLKKAGFSDEEANKITHAKINFKSDKSNPTYDAMNKVININAANIKRVKDLDEFEKAFTHEVGHFISDNIVDPTGFYLKGIPLQGKWVGGSHNTWVPAQDESKELAFEEAGAEFFSQLFYKSENQLYDSGFEDAGRSQSASSGYMRQGNVIEGNIASFLCAYYKDDMKNPQAIYKDFSDTIKKYEEFYTSFRPARNIEEFLDAKLNAKSPGLKYQGDLKDLASKYKIMATDVWEAVLDSPEAVKKVKVLRGKETLDFMPNMTLKKGDKIEVPAGLKVAFQKFSDGWWENGDKDWVNFGPGTHDVAIDDGYNYIKVEYGKAQFVNTSAVSADGKTLIKKDGTNFIVEVDENKNTKVAVLEGAVILQNAGTKQEQKIAANQMTVVSPGKPLAASLQTAPQTSILQQTQWWKMPVEVIIPSQAASSQTAPGVGASLPRMLQQANDGVKRTSIKDGVFLLWLPDGWVVNEKPKNEDKQFEATSADGTKLIQLSALKINLDKAPKNFLQVFVDAYEKELLGSGKLYYEKINPRTISVSGVSSYQTDYKVKSNNLELISVTTFFTVNDKIYIFECLALESEMNDMRKIFNKALESLRIRD